MANITKRRKKNGQFSYRAVVRIKRKGVVVFRASQTFPTRGLAKTWSRKREVELSDPAELERVAGGGVKVENLIHRYVETFGKTGQWQRTKKSDLAALKRSRIAGEDATKLTAGRIIEHVQERRAAGAGPATAMNDLVWLGVVFRAAAGSWELPVDPGVVVLARSQAREHRLIGRSRRRERRPTPDELDALYAYYRRKDGRMRIPMYDIMAFAVASARREAEITRLLWDDLDADKQTGIVRDAKHPRHKIGNHKVFKFSNEGWAIVHRQPKTDVRIFPYNPKSVGAAFTRACHMLGIEDLHFHDLRHEATSRFFEAGYSIPEVTQFTLHESWAELKRYTNLRPGDLKLRDSLPGERL